MIGLPEPPACPNCRKEMRLIEADPQRFQCSDCEPSSPQRMPSMWDISSSSSDPELNVC
jgi:hypothetical protein